jgi:hypothetical protein
MIGQTFADERPGLKIGAEDRSDQAIIALLMSRNTEEAAKSIGGSAKTLQRWQKLPEFGRAYRRVSL